MSPQEAKRLHRHRILERVPVVAFVRVPAAPWLKIPSPTRPAPIDSARLTRWAGEIGD